MMEDAVAAINTAGTTQETFFLSVPISLIRSQIFPRFYSGS